MTFHSHTVDSKLNKNRERRQNRNKNKHQAIITTKSDTYISKFTHSYLQPIHFRLLELIELRSYNRLFFFCLTKKWSYCRSVFYVIDWLILPVFGNVFFCFGSVRFESAFLLSCLFFVTLLRWLRYYYWTFVIYFCARIRTRMRIIYE